MDSRRVWGYFDFQGERVFSSVPDSATVVQNLPSLTVFEELTISPSNHPQGYIQILF